jgi:two-component system, chemotaxis family, CheB/CheR fusion protein
MRDMQHLDSVPGSDERPEERLHDLKRRVYAHSFEHRRQVRSLLAIIRAIVRRMGQSSGSVEDFAAHLEGRLDALARVQEILLRVDGADGADLAELVSGQFLAEAIPESRIESEGPRVRLSARVAASLALALHELTTNAIKFGALSTPHGRISVRWNIDSHDPKRIRLEWQEQGISIVTDAPRHVGFGTELIEKTLPYELRARTALDFAPGGVHCLIEFRADASAWEAKS